MNKCLMIPRRNKIHWNETKLNFFSSFKAQFSVNLGIMGYIYILSFTPSFHQFIYLFYVLFNDTLDTFLINGYISVRNILIGKIPSGYLTGIDLRSRRPASINLSVYLMKCQHICLLMVISVLKIFLSGTTTPHPPPPPAAH